jgi:hypothetical protein
MSKERKGQKKMQNQDNEDCKVCFAGATISKIEANRIGLSIILGICTVFLANLLIDTENKYIIFSICLGSVLLSYFAVSKKIFKNKTYKNS